MVDRSMYPGKRRVATRYVDAECAAASDAIQGQNSVKSLFDRLQLEAVRIFSLRRARARVDAHTRVWQSRSGCVRYPRRR